MSFRDAFFPSGAPPPAEAPNDPAVNKIIENLAVFAAKNG